MRTYKECREALLKNQRAERDAFLKLTNLYPLAEELVRIYEHEFESGKAFVSYRWGSEVVTLTLDAHQGKHPVREALILIDEILYEKDWITEVRYPEKLDDWIFWKFEDESGGRLSIEVKIRESGGCRLVGTGTYEEVMEWKCI